MTRTALAGLALLFVAAAMAAGTAAAGEGKDAVPPAPPVPDAAVPDLVIVVPDCPKGKPVLFPTGDGGEGFVVAVGGSRILTPGVDGRRVFAGSGMHMKAFDALTGANLWTTATGDGGPTAVACMGGRVYFNTASCTLYSMDAETGRTQWSHWIAGSVVTTPTVAGNRVYVSGPNDKGGGLKIECLAVATGKVLYGKSIPQEVLSAPVADGDRLFLALADGSVMALDEKGDVLWERNQQALAAPWPEGGRLLVASGAFENPTLANMDAATGLASRAVATPRDPGARPSPPPEPSKMASGGRNNRGAGRVGGVQRPGLPEGPGKDPSGGPSGTGTPPPNPTPPSSPTPTPVRPPRGGIGGFGYEGPRPCVSGGSAAMAVDGALLLQPVDGLGEVKRLPLVDTNGGRPAGSAVAAGGLFLVATLDGALQAFDAETGDARFTYRFRTASGQPLVIGGSPAIHRGRAYFGTHDGRLVGVDLPDASADGWPMWGGGPGRSK